MKNYKGINDTNPILTGHYGADPYAMEYDGRVYFYMTADKYEYDEKGEIKENSYQLIDTIYVVSTDDMVNFTDHGEIKVAGKNGAAKWADNSWAPAAAWKMIDGKPKFFLYFADAGGGIGVVSADSPVGPFTDPLGHGLIRRDMENCGNVEWLFDPAVLVDDDGEAYIYFGGGVPAGKFADPGTARVAKLGKDMISLDGVPVAINPPYLFEDSGIHKFNNKYYYTYCCNFNVDEEGTNKYGITNGQICRMESDSPMGPFVFKEMILENPEKYCGLGGNNHHCVFKFKDQWYITYHSRILEKNIGVEHGYRITNVDEISIAADGKIGVIAQTSAGTKRIKNVNPFVNNSAVNMSQMSGCKLIPADEVTEKCGSGNMLLAEFEDGGFFEVMGVDFADKKASEVVIVAKNEADSAAEVIVCADDTELAKANISKSTDFITVCASSKEITGVHNLFISVNNGQKLTLKEWSFK